jgi:hypothetical protein
MNTAGTYTSYAKSLLWVALLMAVVVVVQLVVELVFVDFVHGNPHRSLADTIEMMMLIPPISGLVAIIGTFLVFTAPQCFQAILTDILIRQYGRRALFLVIVTLPATAVLTWYCYDYLTPTDINLGINAGPDWTPYQHGLTLRRYQMTLAVQTPISLFSLLYYDATICDRPKKLIIVSGLLLAFVSGVFWGHWQAETQYQFL